MNDGLIPESMEYLKKYYLEEINTSKISFILINCRLANN